MQTGSTSSPVRFSSTIRFVSKETFEKVTASGMTPVSDTENSSAAYTSGIIMCNAGGVTGATNDQCTLFHFYDDDKSDPKEKQLARLAQAVDALKSNQTQSKLRALLIGGQSMYDSSVDLGKALHTFFKDRNIPLSILWGHRRHDELGTFLSDIAYSAKDDTWTVFTRTNRGSHVVNSRQRLGEAFEGIDIYRGSKTQKADVIEFENAHQQ